MGNIKFAFVKGGPKRLEISYQGNFNDISVRLDGNEIGTMADFNELKAGKEFPMPDGSVLKIQFLRVSIFPYFHILKDGKPLSSMGPEPAERLKMVYKFIFLFGFCNFLIGLMDFLFPRSNLNLPATGILPILLGCIFLVLGIFIMRRSVIALKITIGILLLDLILALIFRPHLPLWLFIGAIVFRIMILFILMQGFVAIYLLNQNEKSELDKSKTVSQ